MKCQRSGTLDTFLKIIYGPKKGENHLFRYTLSTGIINAFRFSKKDGNELSRKSVIIAERWDWVYFGHTNNSFYDTCTEDFTHSVLFAIAGMLEEA